MDLVLKRKFDQNDFDPLVIVINDQDNKKKMIKKVALNEVVSLPDHLAHKVMADYKGLFEVKQNESKSKKEA